MVILNHGRFRVILNYGGLRSHFVNRIWVSVHATGQCIRKGIEMGWRNSGKEKIMGVA